MNQKRQTITINNFFCIPLEKFKELINSNQIPLNSKSIFSSSNQNIFPIEKDNFKYKIVKQQQLIFSVNNKDNKTSEKIIPKDKAKDLVIEIKKNQQKKFLSNKKIFKFESFKKIGRKPKNSLAKGYHTKFSLDNILRKIKVQFFKKLVKYINNIIKNKYSRKVYLLKPLFGKISQNNSKNFNRALLNTKLKDIFSSFEINGKFKSVDKEYNKIVINLVYEKNLTELIDIFEMTFLDVFNAFIEKNKTEKLNGLENLDSVVEEIKKKENDVYVDKFQKVAMDFEKYYLKKNCKNMIKMA